MPNMIVIKKDYKLFLAYHLREFNYSLVLYFYITKNIYNDPRNTIYKRKKLHALSIFGPEK